MGVKRAVPGSRGPTGGLAECSHQPGGRMGDRGRQPSLIALFLLGIVAFTSPGLAQTPPEVVLVGATSGCEECSIGVTRTLELEAGPGALGFSDAVMGYSAGSAGFVVVDQVALPERFILFSSRGELIGEVGGSGDGPGEFLAATQILPSEGDSLLLHDMRRRAVSVFDGDHTFARRFLLPANPGITGGWPAILRFADGGIVMNAALGSVEGVGLPLHFVDAEGTVTRSVGSGPPSVSSHGHPTQARVLAFASPSTFWAAHGSRYEIELWDREGALVKSLRREVDWFPPLEEGQAPSLIGPGVQGLFQDAGGLLWVLIRVPNPDAPGMILPERERLVQEGRGAMPSRAEADRRFDTVIEVIDPETGTLMATRRLDEYVNVVDSSGLIFTYEERPTWEGRLVVWALELRR